MEKSSSSRLIEIGKNNSTRCVAMRIKKKRKETPTYDSKKREEKKKNNKIKQRVAIDLAVHRVKNLLHTQFQFLLFQTHFQMRRARSLLNNEEKSDCVFNYQFYANNYTKKMV